MGILLGPRELSVNGNRGVSVLERCPLGAVRLKKEMLYIL